jgi:hypothetical protein
MLTIQQQQQQQQQQHQQQQQQQPQQLIISDELNFTAFIDLCRFCSIKSGPRVHIFDKEADQRQLLFKIRTLLPTAVSSKFGPSDVGEN